MTIDLEKRVIHRFIRNISEYETGGELYSQIIPLDIQAYAIYPNGGNNKLYYVIGDGEHTYTELRSGLGNGTTYKEYPVLTKENLETIIGGIEAEEAARKAADVVLQTNIDNEKTRATTAEASLSSNLTTHISNKANPHEVTKAQVGLGNVDNTSDINKPISTATQTALNAKQDTLVSGTNIKTINNNSLLGSGNIEISEPTKISDLIDDTATNPIDKANTLTGLTASVTELNYVDGVTSAIQTQLDAKVEKNEAITAATHTKITYDAKGLITAGADLTAEDIPSLTLAKISDVTATAAEVNVLDGIEASTAELNYVKGVTSAIQTQLNAKLTTADIVDNVTSTATDKALSANQGKVLQEEIDNLKSIGRFLSEWDCSTGKPETEPSSLPYTYHTGDYYIVGTVSSATPAVNYKPDGTQYTGAASTVTESAEVAVNDMYYFDGTVWKLLHNTQKTVTFANIAGNATDNASLASELNKKVDANSAITAATHTKITYDAKGLVTAGADLEESDIPSLHLAKITDVTATAAEVNVLDGIEASTAELNIMHGVTATTAELNVLDGIEASTTELNYVKGVTSSVQTQLDAKQATLTGAATTIASDNLTASRAVISNADGKVAVSDTTSTELGYVHGVTSSIQAQLDAKQGEITGAASTIATANLTANRALISNADGKVAISDVTSTELGYLDGVTSNVQTQLDAKVEKNEAITAATKTKITYDAKGLVTAGADLEESDIPSLHLAKISDVTATAAEVNVLDGITASTEELNILDGVTATTTELNYVHGVTSAIQTQLDAKLTTADIVDNVTSTATDKALSANQGKTLQNQIDDLKARGRLLSIWQESLGKPQTEPPGKEIGEIYQYSAGDYYLISSVAEAGGINYRPSGTTYIVGSTSTTVETETVDESDVYYFDGTQWMLWINTQKTVTFTNIAGSPYDNTNLASSLNAKQNVLTAGSNVQINGSVISATDTTYTAGTGIDITNGVISNTQTSAEWGNITGTLSSQTDLQNALNAKQNTLTAGDNITITNNTISADYPTYVRATKTLRFGE